MKNWLFRSVALMLFAATLNSCSTTKVAPRAGCHRFLLVAPKHFDFAAAGHLTKRYYQARKSLIEADCHSIVDIDQSFELLRLMGRQETETMTVQSFSNGQLERIAAETAATHLLFLRYRNTRTKLRIQPQAYRISNRSRIKIPKSYRLNDRIEADSPLITAQSQRIYLRFLDLLPNSLVVGLSFSTLRFEPTTSDHEIIGQSTLPGILPPLFSSLAFQNILAPYSTDFWDLSFRWTTYAATTYLREPRPIPADFNRRSRVAGHRRQWRDLAHRRRWRRRL